MNSKRQKNINKSKNAAKIIFPEEKWINAAKWVLDNLNKTENNLPDMTGISIAKSRLTDSKNDEKILIKELIQSKILADKGFSIFLLPKMKNRESFLTPCSLSRLQGRLEKWH